MAVRLMTVCFFLTLFSFVISDSMANKFLYFAYGSNLLASRIHINNPSAERLDIAKLKDYRLDFNYYSQRWQGCAATVVPDKGKHVYGALWTISNDDMADLDRQEGVDSKVYEVIKVSVESPEGKLYEARSYQLCDLPPSLPDGESLPAKRHPSKIYLDTIINGAKESKLPQDYIQFLESIPHNGYDGNVNLKQDN